MVLTALTPVTAQGQLGGRWARRPGERWEARRASPLSPGPGAWDWSRSRGLLALCPGLTLGESSVSPNGSGRRRPGPAGGRGVEAAVRLRAQVHVAAEVSRPRRVSRRLVCGDDAVRFAHVV